jgi:ssDNA-binding Zn-finger/Zn-ribbon topoisomerase 1
MLPGAPWRSFCSTTGMADYLSNPCEAVPTCPICGGRMELVYDRPELKACACVECESGLSVPTKAWGIARARQQTTRS